MSYPFGPYLPPWERVMPQGVLDPEADDPWTYEYMRVFHRFIRWRETGVPGVGHIYFVGYTANGFIEEYKAKGEKVIVIDEDLPNDGLDHYYDIKAGIVRPKEPSPAILDGITLRNLPPGAVIEVDGERYSAEDQDAVELEFDHLGTYQVTVMAPAHLPITFEVDRR